MRYEAAFSLLLCLVPAGVQAQGIIRTVAGGGTGTFCGDGGRAALACLLNPSGAAVDPKGGIVIADTANHRVRRITPGGVITTIAGNGVAGFAGDGGPATGTSLRSPSSVAIDHNGNLFILDAGNSRLRRVALTGTIVTVAGTGVAGYSGDGGPASQAQISPSLDSGLAVDAQDNLYLTDTGNHRVRKITPAGIITTIAGNGQAGFSGDNGPATAASLNRPSGTVAVDTAGNLYIPDTDNDRVRRVAASGSIVTTVAGNGVAGFAGDGGPPTQASLRRVIGVALDGAGRLYINDTGNNRVRRVAIITLATGATTARINTVAGGGTTLPGDGGLSTDIYLNAKGVAVDFDGNLFIANTAPNLVHKVIGLTAMPGPVSFAPASLTFTAVVGGDPPDTQTIVLGSRELSAFAFGTHVATSDGGRWLRLDPRIGRVPTGIRVTVNPENLPAGSFNGNITIEVPQATNAPLTIPVKLTLTAPAPSMDVTPEGLRLSATQGGANPPPHGVRIHNRGGGSLSWTASAKTFNGGNWLSVDPPGGVAPSATHVWADITGLKAGLYQGVVMVRSPTTGQAERIPVNLHVSSADGILQASQSGLVFFALEGAGLLPTRSFNVLNGGRGTLNWTAQVLSRTGGNWLAISPSSGASDTAGSPPAITLTANATGLVSGTYHAAIRLDAPGATNTPVFVSSVLNVLPPGSEVPLIPTPQGLMFRAGAGDAPPAAQSLRVSTGSATAANFIIAAAEMEGDDWLAVTPTSGTVSATSPVMVAVSVDPGGLSPGSYTGLVTVSLPDGATRSVNIVFVVTPAAAPASTSAINSAAGAPAGSACTPTKLVPVHTALANSFLAPVAWPTPLVVRVSDDCGADVTAATVLTSFSNGDSPLAMQSLKNGQYAATWTPANPSAQVTVTSTALAAGLQNGVARISGAAGSNAQPFVFSNGAVHAASFTPRAPLAPGSIFSIFGSRLNSGQAQAGSIPLPTTLGDVSATLGGLDVPLYFASPGQVNAQMPFQLTAGNTAQLSLKVGGQFTVPENITISGAQPGIFTLNQSGTGTGAILDANSAPINEANPAKPGAVIQVFATGLGKTEPAVDSGVMSPSNPPAKVTQAVTASVDGIAAAVQFAGLAPNFVGLYQVNLVVPDGVRDGEVAVIITQDGVDSNTATIRIRK